MVKVGIVGATGYMGGEALRVLLEHPETQKAFRKVLYNPDNVVCNVQQ